MKIKSICIKMVKVFQKIGKVRSDIFWKYDTQIQIEDNHLKDYDVASSAVFTACLHVQQTCDFTRVFKAAPFLVKNEK